MTRNCRLSNVFENRYQEQKIRSFRSHPLLKTLTIAWCKRWHKRKDPPIYSPADRTNGRQFSWHTVFHCQKSKLRMQLRWNNVRSEVIYERDVEAMGLPVRVVNCGTTIGDRIRGYIPTPTKTTTKRITAITKRITPTEISYTFSARLFHGWMSQLPRTYFYGYWIFFRNT